jgi:hypothetical protein
MDGVNSDTERARSITNIQVPRTKNKKKTARYHAAEDSVSLEYVFSSHVPIEVLFEVLEQICIKKDKYYLMDFNAFRLLKYRNLYPEFASIILPAYRPSKQYFVTRELTYNSFATIIRQICRINRVTFDTKFNYQHSMYNIDYFIYYPSAENPSATECTPTKI